jgi:hypothetical protein
MTAARRLAAILAADVVGYSRLMGEDKAGTLGVREHRDAARPFTRRGMRYSPNADPDMRISQQFPVLLSS